MLVPSVQTRPSVAQFSLPPSKSPGTEAPCDNILNSPVASAFISSGSGIRM